MTANTQKSLPPPRDYSAIEAISGYADLFVANLFSALEQKNLMLKFSAVQTTAEKKQSKIFHQSALNVITLDPKTSTKARWRQAQAKAGVIHLEQVNLLTRAARRVMSDDAIAGQMPIIMGFEESLTLLARYAGPDATQVAAQIRIPQIIAP